MSSYSPSFLPRCLQLLRKLDSIPTAGARESFTVYVLGRESSSQPEVPPDGHQYRESLNAAVSIGSSNSFLFEEQPAGGKRRRAGGASSIRAQLSGIHPAVLVTPRVFMDSAVVVPGVDFEVRFTGSVVTGLQLVAMTATDAACAGLSHDEMTAVQLAFVNDWREDKVVIGDAGVCVSVWVVRPHRLCPCG